MFIVQVIVCSNCHILQFLHQMFNVSSLLLDDALKPATPLTNGAINGVAGLSRPTLTKGRIAGAHGRYPRPIAYGGLKMLCNLQQFAVAIAEGLSVGRNSGRILQLLQGH